MIICHCNRVTDRDISEAIKKGSRTLVDVCKLTGAAECCSGCVDHINDIIKKKS